MPGDDEFLALLGLYHIVVQSKLFVISIDIFVGTIHFALICVRDAVYILVYCSYDFGLAPMPYTNKHCT